MILLISSSPWFSRYSCCAGAALFLLRYSCRGILGVRRGVRQGIARHIRCASDSQPPDGGNVHLGSRRCCCIRSSQ